MDLVLQGFKHALGMILRGDPQVMEIMWLSLRVSGIATLISLVAGVPFGTVLALAHFPGRRLLVGIINAGMGLPPVAVGLFVSILLWRSGPLGFLELMYSPTAIVVAQCVIAFPVVAGLTAAAVQQVDPRLRLQLLGLGASRIQALGLLLREARFSVLAAIMAGFGAVISEVGASMMVGGNILHSTRVLTTATVLETSKGNFDVAIALSVLLLALTFLVTMLLTLIQQRGVAAMNGAPALLAEGLVVRYGGRRVLDVERLALVPGRTLALLGPNGSGKSTLLRVLALLERPTEGRLMLLGEGVAPGESRRLALRRRIATVFQAPLLTDQTVAENVALGLRFRGIRGSGTTTRVTRWLDRFGIGHLARQRARTLSGGEAQRVSLARAFVVEPELLFLDEPFASLDLHGREALALELDAILREARIATVLVTHERSEAMMLGDEIAVLMEGRLAQRDAMRVVLSQPATEPVARFLGVENLFRVRVAAQPGEEREVELAGRRFFLPLSPDILDTAVLCLRAEDVHLASPGTAPEPGSVGLPARVVRMVPYGVPWRIHLDAGIPLIALAAQRTVERLRLEPGMELVASFDPARVHAVPAVLRP